MSEILKKYAQLLTGYCLEVRPGDKVFISTTTLAVPLVQEIYRTMLDAGAALIEFDLQFEGRDEILLENGSEQALRTASPFRHLAMTDFDVYLYIRAPFLPKNEQEIDANRQKVRSEAGAETSKIYFERTATGSLRRNLCQFPTEAAARTAGMTLLEYEKFVFEACHLFDPDPAQSWLTRRHDQQKIVDLLNQTRSVRYRCEGTDITFSCEGRRWINSDGQTNMPSGEVYTSPVENTVNGTIYFSYPSIFQGNEVHGVQLWVKDGYIERWEAQQGKAFLDKIFEIPGTRRFGEAAIGTNFNIQKMTKNILFDEKIGGTVHMAIGQSYLQAGGKNESAIHWDLITDMTRGGEIFADDELIYQSGKFLMS